MECQPVLILPDTVKYNPRRNSWLSVYDHPSIFSSSNTIVHEMDVTQKDDDGIRKHLSRLSRRSLRCIKLHLHSGKGGNDRKQMEARSSIHSTPIEGNRNIRRSLWSDQTSLSDTKHVCNTSASDSDSKVPGTAFFGAQKSSVGSSSAITTDFRNASRVKAVGEEGPSMQANPVLKFENAGSSQDVAQGGGRPAWDSEKKSFAPRTCNDPIVRHRNFNVRSTGIDHPVLPGADFGNRRLATEETASMRIPSSSGGFLGSSSNNRESQQRVKLPIQKRSSCPNIISNRQRAYAPREFWTQEEDARLRLMVRTYGEGKWAKIELHFPNRKASAIRTRWSYAVNPKLSDAAFTPEEDRVILNLKRRGLGISHMRKELPHRADIKITNRFKSIITIFVKLSGKKLEDLTESDVDMIVFRIHACNQ